MSARSNAQSLVFWVAISSWASAGCNDPMDSGGPSSSGPDSASGATTGLGNSRPSTSTGAFATQGGASSSRSSSTAGGVVATQGGASASRSDRASGGQPKGTSSALSTRPGQGGAVTASQSAGIGGHAATTRSNAGGARSTPTGGMGNTTRNPPTGGTVGAGGSTNKPLMVGGALGVGGVASTVTTSSPASVAPQLPSISGTCPAFATGTVTVAGLSGISLQVGAKKNGTGALLFYWHGTGSTASEVNRLIPSTVRQEILSEGGVIVSFQDSLGTGGDCSGTSTFSKDDFKVADLIAACAVQNHGIDPRRIYTTGCSAGGLQAGCMGALRSSYVAAVVPNSGGLVMAQTIQDKSHIPAVMTMHGGTGDRVVVSFSETSATYDRMMDTAGGYVVNCNHGGGHCQAPADLYTAGWEFMKAHPFGVDPEPYSAGLPASFPNYCQPY